MGAASGVEADCGGRPWNLVPKQSMLQARSPSRMFEDSLRLRFCHLSGCFRKMLSTLHADSMHEIEVGRWALNTGVGSIFLYRSQGLGIGLTRGSVGAEYCSRGFSWVDAIEDSECPAVNRAGGCWRDAFSSRASSTTPIPAEPAPLAAAA